MAALSALIGPLVEGRARQAAIDRNGDGRADVWRFFDRNGELVGVAVDDNFDSQFDRYDQLAGGQLIRRRIDRNFDSRVDLVEEFDATTGDIVRVEADEEFDGRSDRIAIFRDGHIAYQGPATPEGRLTRAYRVPDCPLDSLAGIPQILLPPAPAALGGAMLARLSAALSAAHHPSLDVLVDPDRGPPLPTLL